MPPPQYRYPVPSLSTNTAGSNSQTTPDIPGVLDVTSALPSGSVHGPIGLSAVRTPIPPVPFAKYRKNLSLPFMFFTAAAGAQDDPAHFAIPWPPLAPFAPATGMAP
ncbi:hypothetical protein D3C72_2184090 [compost metagenome]